MESPAFKSGKIEVPLTIGQVVDHPGIDSGIDLINSGIAETLAVSDVTHRDYTGNHVLFALKDHVAVARWQPDYWRKEGYYQAGWYCAATHKLLLIEKYWGIIRTE